MGYDRRVADGGIGACPTRASHRGIECRGSLPPRGTTRIGRAMRQRPGSRSSPRRDKRRQRPVNMSLSRLASDMTATSGMRSLAALRYELHGRALVQHRAALVGQADGPAPRACGKGRSATLADRHPGVGWFSSSAGESFAVPGAVEAGRSGGRSGWRGGTADGREAGQRTGYGAKPDAFSLGDRLCRSAASTGADDRAA